MEHMFKKILALSLLASTGAAVADCNSSCNSSCNEPATPITCLVPRSQSFNNVIKNAGMDPDNQFLYDVDGWNGSFKLTFEYDHTFNSYKLGECLFGAAAVCATGCNDDAIALNIVGSTAATLPNGTTDLVADNFLLPTDYSSTVLIKPSIQNFNVHLQAYFGFDEWCTGLYARVYAPITVTKWKLDTTETQNATAAATYAAGTISGAAVPVAGTFPSFLNYTQGNVVPADGTLPGGATVAQLQYTRFGGCDSQTSTQLADLRAELGWNFLLDEDYHFGLYIAAAAPTGNDCDSGCDRQLWGAKAGNGKHWELGGGLTGHYTMWRSEDCEQQFDFVVDATINHMFKHTELRTFDLIDNPLSRYIIVEQLAPAAATLAVGGANATYQFSGAFVPLANLTTQNVSVSFPVQADVMAKFVYTCKGFSWALGYDFWAQACPHVDLACSDDCNSNSAGIMPFPANTYAFRGNAQLYGFAGTTAVATPIPATVGDTTVFNIGATNTANSSVNTPGAAVLGTTALNTTGAAPLTPLSASTTPVFISASDINYCNITKGLSNTIFTELNYTWIDRECWVPYLGIGARVEFGSNGAGSACNNTNVVTPTTTTANMLTNCNSSCNNSCSGCGTCSVTKWGIWIQGGLSFN